MERDELISFLKKNMKVELHAINNSRHSRLEVKIKIADEEIDSDYVSLDELQE